MAQPLTNFDETQYHGVLSIVPKGCEIVPEMGSGERLAVDLNRTCPRRYTAASFVGSIALQGSMHMDAMERQQAGQAVDVAPAPRFARAETCRLSSPG